jgi:hypothetical protein
MRSRLETTKTLLEVTKREKKLLEQRQKLEEALAYESDDSRGLSDFDSEGDLVTVDEEQGSVDHNQMTSDIVTRTSDVEPRATIPIHSEKDVRVAPYISDIAARTGRITEWDEMTYEGPRSTGYGIRTLATNWIGRGRPGTTEEPITTVYGNTAALRQVCVRPEAVRQILTEPVEQRQPYKGPEVTRQHQVNFDSLIVHREPREAP